MKVLTSSQMFSAEQAQVNRGMSFTRLMENAGSACAREIRAVSYTHLTLPTT